MWPQSSYLCTLRVGLKNRHGHWFRWISTYWNNCFMWRTHTQRELSNIKQRCNKDLNPFRTPVPFWGQTTYNLSILSPHTWDCGAKSVNEVSLFLFCQYYVRLVYLLTYWRKPINRILVPHTARAVFLVIILDKKNVFLFACFCFLVGCLFSFHSFIDCVCRAYRI